MNKCWVSFFLQVTSSVGERDGLPPPQLGPEIKETAEEKKKKASCRQPQLLF